MRCSIRPIRKGEEAFCEQALRALPDWFGIESAIVHYVEQTRKLPTWIAEADGLSAGFITVKQHSSHAAEISCMAVIEQHHRRGVGRAMVEFVERELCGLGVRFLQVKTLGPSRPSAHYDRTRRFYEAIGFVALEELPNLWPGNPCLLMVKRVDGQ